jgi:hypothetical protein
MREPRYGGAELLSAESFQKATRFPPVQVNDHNFINPFAAERQPHKQSAVLIYSHIKSRTQSVLGQSRYGYLTAKL